MSEEAAPASATPTKSTKMDMALDDIIKKTKTTPKRGGGRGRRGRGGRNKGSPGAMNGRWVLGIASSVGGRQSLQTSGPPKLHISNLAPGVTDTDIQGIFSDFGSMRTAAIHYNKKGKSLGTADVVFVDRLDAMKAMTMINGIPLDGKPMKISIEGGVGVTGGRPTDIVKRLGPRVGGGAQGIGSFETGRPGRRGGRRGRGGRGRGRGGKPETPKTAEELDAEMDAYVKNKGKTAEELDAEMDAYAEESKAANGTAEDDE